MNWQDCPETSSISMPWGRQEGKEEVIRKIQALYGKPNRAGHFPCDNYSYNQAWGIGNGPAYSSCPAKTTAVPVKGKSMMMCFFFFFSVGRVTMVRVAIAAEKGSRGTWPLREKLTNELHYWGAYQGDPLECVMYYLASNFHTPPTSPIKPDISSGGREACKLK